MQIVNGRANRGGKAAEERHSRCDRELLAGHGVEKALEDCREARWFQAAVSLGEVVEHIVSSGPDVKGGQVDVEPEQPTEETFDLRLGSSSTS